MSVKIRLFQESDWEQVKFVYEAGIATGNATFETSAPSYEKWVSTLVDGSHLVAELGGKIVGWCKITKVSDRCVYAGVGEVSVYVLPAEHGKGIGSNLLSALIKFSEEQGYWTLNAGIFPENHASVSLHKKFGFREVGRRERLGKLQGVWRDVLLLERRSQEVGID